MASAPLEAVSVEDVINAINSTITNAPLRTVSFDVLNPVSHVTNDAISNEGSKGGKSISQSSTSSTSGTSSQSSTSDTDSNSDSDFEQSVKSSNTRKVSSLSLKRPSTSPRIGVGRGKIMKAYGDIKATPSTSSKAPIATVEPKPDNVKAVSKSHEAEVQSEKSDHMSDSDSEFADFSQSDDRRLFKKFYKRQHEIMVEHRTLRDDVHSLTDNVNMAEEDLQKVDSEYKEIEKKRIALLKRKKKNFRIYSKN